MKWELTEYKMHQMDIASGLTTLVEHRYGISIAGKGGSILKTSKHRVATPECKKHITLACAAPVMLNALKFARAYMSSLDMVPDTKRHAAVQKIVKAAIARAETL